MKRELRAVLTVFVIGILLFSVSMSLMADDEAVSVEDDYDGITYEETSLEGEGDVGESKWVLVHAKKMGVHIVNDSNDYLIIKYDNYVNHYGKTIEEEMESGLEKFYLSTLIKPHEYLILPNCEEIFIRVSISRVEKTGADSLKITDGVESNEEEMTY